MDNQYGPAVAFPLSPSPTPAGGRSIRRTTGVGCHAPAVGTACLQMTLRLRAGGCPAAQVGLLALLLAISDAASAWRASTPR